MGCSYCLFMQCNPQVVKIATQARFVSFPVAPSPHWNWMTGQKETRPRSWGTFSISSSTFGVLWPMQRRWVNGWSRVEGVLGGRVLEGKTDDASLWEEIWKLFQPCKFWIECLSLSRLRKKRNGLIHDTIHPLAITRFKDEPIWKHRGVSQHSARQRLWALPTQPDTCAGGGCLHRLALSVGPHRATLPLSRGAFLWCNDILYI